MERPKKLYKYQAYKTTTLENLINHQIFFSNPKDFNDPFDCRIPINPVFSDTVYEKIFKNLCDKPPNDEGIKRDYLTNGKINERFKEDIIKNVSVIMDGMAAIHGVACFSTKKEDILMWAHYADGHKGLCLEFDPTGIFDANLKKVDYWPEFPPIDWYEIIRNKSVPEYMKQLTTKFLEWEHEAEWRIIYGNYSKFWPYPPKALTAIYFGCEMPPPHREIIKKITKDQNKDIEFYEMIKDKKKFAVSPEKI